MPKSCGDPGSKALFHDPSDFPRLLILCKTAVSPHQNKNIPQACVIRKELVSKGLDGFPRFPQALLRLF